MSEAQDIWPLPDYDPGPHKHLHAIGVIAITYSAFERSLQDFYFFRDLSQNLSQTLKTQYLKSDDKKKMSLLRKAFAECKVNPEIPDLGSNLVDYFGWCQKCRHQILHSERYPAIFSGPDIVHLTKPAGRQNPERIYMGFSLPQLRFIADKIREGWNQSARMQIYLRYHEHHTEVTEECRNAAIELPHKLAIPIPIESRSTP